MILIDIALFLPASVTSANVWIALLMDIFARRVIILPKRIFFLSFHPLKHERTDMNQNNSLIFKFLFELLFFSGTQFLWNGNSNGNFRKYIDSVDFITKGLKATPFICRMDRLKRHTEAIDQEFIARILKNLACVIGRMAAGFTEWNCGGKSYTKALQKGGA